MATMKTLNGYGFNATEFDGKTASDYLLKTDTAADSAKLGGKAPEYYIQPRNLLDNSDFRNPVNQRGQTGYFGVVYTIDRWSLWSANSNASLSTDGNIVAINPNGDDEVALTQRFAKGYLSEEKTYTFAYLDTQGTIHIDNNPVKYVVEAYDYVEIKRDAWTGVVWAALYEGSYTVDTLPPYVPKGYAVELAECQRYFRKGMQAVTIGNQYNNSGSLFSLSVPRMRIKPTVTLTEISSQGWGNVAASNYTLGWNGDLGSSFYANYIYSVSEDVGKTVVVSYEMSADL